MASWGQTCNEEDLLKYSFPDFWICSFLFSFLPSFLTCPLSKQWKQSFQCSAHSPSCYWQRATINISLNFLVHSKEMNLQAEHLLLQLQLNNTCVYSIINWENFAVWDNVLWIGTIEIKWAVLCESMENESSTVFPVRTSQMKSCWPGSSLKRPDTIQPVFFLHGRCLDMWTYQETPQHPNSTLPVFTCPPSSWRRAKPRSSSSSWVTVKTRKCLQLPSVSFFKMKFFKLCDFSSHQICNKGNYVFILIPSSLPPGCSLEETQHLSAAYPNVVPVAPSCGQLALLDLTAPFLFRGTNRYYG